MAVTPAETGFFRRFIERPVRRALEWAVSVNTVHPSTHRLKNALGLSVGMVGGRYGMDKLVGQTPDGDKVEREDVPTLFQPLHGTLAYNHYSDRQHDRVMHLADMWIPAGLGAVGAYLGSYDYAFADQPYASAAKGAIRNAKALTLDKAEDAAMAAQSLAWRSLSGMTAVFGSSSNIQLVPGPWNYGSDLSIAFQGTVARNKLHTPYFKGLQKFVNGNAHPYPFGPSSMLGKLKGYLLHSPDAQLPQARQMAYSILEPWFGQRVTEQHIDAFLVPMLEAREKLYRPGGVPQSAKADFEKTLNGFLAGEGLERHLLKLDLNPATAMVGRNGFTEYAARAMGSGERMAAVERTYRSGLVQRGVITELPRDVERVNAATRAADRYVLTRGSLVLGGMALGVTYLAHQALSAQKKWWNGTESNREAAKPEAGAPMEAAGTALASPAQAGEQEDAHGSRSERRPILSFVERVTEGLNAPTTMSMHRTSCAAGLTIGGYIGTQVANAITGRLLSGAPLPKDKVPEFLEWMYNKFPYNPHSDHARDRWGYILHFGIPAVFATAGVIASSDLFFRNRRKSVHAESEYLEDFENRATMAEANTWTPLTALGSLFVTPSGFPFLPYPAPNYGTALGTRFMLASGRKGVFPGLGELWTGSTSPYAEGPVALRDRMLRYATNNPDPHPEQLDAMARGIVLQWFPDATPAQVKSFVRKMERDREQFYRDGVGIPEDLKTECYDLLATHFKDAGLERTLRELGLDPLHAVLGNNGLSETIARKLGTSDELDDIHKEFAAKYKERLAQEAPAPQKPETVIAAYHVERLHSRQAAEPQVQIGA